MKCCRNERIANFFCFVLVVKYLPERQGLPYPTSQADYKKSPPSLQMRLPGLVNFAQLRALLHTYNRWAKCGARRWTDLWHMVASATSCTTSCSMRDAKKRLCDCDSLSPAPQRGGCTEHFVRYPSFIPISPATLLVSALREAKSLMYLKKY